MSNNTIKLKDTFREDGFYVTQNYFARPDYYSQFNLLGHEGVDFGHANKQIMVRAPLGGTVFTAYNSSYGNYAVIENYTQKCGIYLCHLDSLKVDPGQEVRAGQQIGEMGLTGNSTGEHVHFNFIILDDNGSNKYHQKQYNWGYLDPLYPRDTGNPKFFSGVEQYNIDWGEGDNNMSDTEEVAKLKQQIEGLQADLDNSRSAHAADNDKNSKIISDLEIELAEEKAARQRDVEVLAEKLACEADMVTILKEVEKLIVAEEGLQKCLDDKRDCNDKYTQEAAKLTETYETLTRLCGVPVASVSGIGRGLKAFARLHNDPADTSTMSIAELITIIIKRMKELLWRK